MKWLCPFLIGWLLLAAGTPEEPAARAGLARADTDTVRQRIATVAGDSLVGWREGEDEVQHFIGHVTGTQDSTFLRADQAMRFVAQDLVRLTGHVRVVDRGDSLLADTVLYDESNKVGRASGNVRLSDGDVEAYAPEGTYFVEEKRVHFGKGLRLVDSAAVISGHEGTYWTDRKQAELGGSVRLLSDDTYLEADSLTYHRDTEYSLARGGVFMERWGRDADSTLRTLVFGQRAENDGKEGRRRVRGQPVVIQLRRDSVRVDSLVARAERLDLVESSGICFLTGAGGVRFWRQDVAAIADSMSHTRMPDSTREVIWLEGAPMLWLEDTQVSGDTIRVVATSGAVDSVLVMGSAFVAQLDTVTGRINQVRGRALTASMRDDSTRLFVVRGNAEALYFRRDENDQPDGAVQVSGDEATLLVRGNEPKELRFGEHRGTVFPERALPASLELEGFRWLPERRPEKISLLGAAAGRLGRGRRP